MAILTLFACKNESSKSDAKINLASNMDSVSYGIGVSQAKGILGQVPTVNIEALLKGFKDVADSANLMIADAEIQACLQDFSTKMRTEQMAKKQKEDEVKYAGVKEAGIKFLEENKKNPKVKVTASGLQYIIERPGTGKQPVATDNVTVHYKGTTPEGVIFDSSYDRKEPATFKLNQVIPGWTEGVALMKEGAKYKFFIPQELAYGANPRPGSPIKPYMPLVFEVHLIKVVQ